MPNNFYFQSISRFIKEIFCLKIVFSVATQKATIFRRDSILLGQQANLTVVITLHCAKLRRLLCQREKLVAKPIRTQKTPLPFLDSFTNERMKNLSVKGSFMP